MKKRTVAMEALLLQPNSEFCEERKDLGGSVGTSVNWTRSRYWSKGVHKLYSLLPADSREPAGPAMDV